MTRTKEIRDKFGFSQQDFADKLGEKRHKIADIETGKQKLPIEIAEKIEEIFHINPWWLLTGKGNILMSQEIPSPSEPANTLKNHIGDLEMEIINAFRELSADKQELFYHRIKAEAVEERLKNQDQNISDAKYA